MRNTKPLICSRRGLISLNPFNFLAISYICYTLYLSENSCLLIIINLTIITVHIITDLYVIVPITMTNTKNRCQPAMSR